MNEPKSNDDPVFVEGSPAQSTKPVPKRAAVRPAGLTCICVLAILLGGTGLLMGAVWFVSGAVESGIEQALAGIQARTNSPRADFQREMQARRKVIGDRYMWA